MFEWKRITRLIAVYKDGSEVDFTSAVVLPESEEPCPEETNPIERFYFKTVPPEESGACYFVPAKTGEITIGFYDKDANMFCKQSLIAPEGYAVSEVDIYSYEKNTFGYKGGPNVKITKREMFLVAKATRNQ